MSLSTRICSIILLSITICLSAGEVDPYLVWNHSLRDASDVLNRYYNRKINEVLANLPEDCSCETAAGDILKYFGVTLNAPVEKWIKLSNQIQKFPDKKTDKNILFRKSIYWKPGTPAVEKGQMISLDVMLDQSINVNGIFIGVDKLTHFTGSGYLYYKRYLFARKRGDSKLQAMEKAIDLGIISENNILGRYGTGVFSFADLEANFQGLLLGLDLCQNGKTRLKKNRSRWTLDEPFDIRNYVNPNWNEAYNPSYYYEGKNLSLFPKSITVLTNLPKYCEMFNSQPIQELFIKYNAASVPSFSVQYLRKLIQAKDIPNSRLFDIRKICPKKALD